MIVFLEMNNKILPQTFFGRIVHDKNIYLIAVYDSNDSTYYNVCYKKYIKIYII